MENFRSQALDLVHLLERFQSSWSSWASIHWLTWSYTWHGSSWATIVCMLLEFEPPLFCTYRCVLEVSPRLLAITWRKTTFPINKRELPPSGKFTKYSKCSLLAICIFLSARCSQDKNFTTVRDRKSKHTARMLAKTIRYPFLMQGWVVFL